MERDTEIVCTAQRDADGNAPNILFTPPCECLNCAPDELPAVNDQPEHMWLTSGGRRKRFEIDRVELGEEASGLL